MSRPEAPSLVADCEHCFALCCVLLPFSAVSGFGIDKPGGTPCPNLADDDRCSIHATLRRDGWSGCVTFDCFGAGQQVSQVTYGGVSWREHDNLGEMAAVLSVMRLLHEMLAHLTEVERRSPDPAAADAGGRDRRHDRSHSDRAARRRPRRPARPGRSRARGGQRPAPHRRRASGAGTWPGVTSATDDLHDADLRGALLIGADLREQDLGRADLLGADLRDADLRGADLGAVLFLSQSQVNAALGRRRYDDPGAADAATRRTGRDARPWAGHGVGSERGATVMTASFLQASLFTSVVAFGVAVMAAVIGIVLILLGIALRRLVPRGHALTGG